MIIKIQRPFAWMIAESEFNELEKARKDFSDSQTPEEFYSKLTESQRIIAAMAGMALYSRVVKESAEIIKTSDFIKPKG